MVPFIYISRLGWPLLIILCLLPTIEWLVFKPLSLRFDGPVTAMLSLGQVMGIIGLTMFSFNLLLTTRVRWFEDLFGGLNKVFIAHHIIGGLTFIFLMAHPVFLALRLVPSGLRQAALLLVPQTNNLPVSAGIIALLGLIALMFVTFYTKLPYRIWLITHKLLGPVFFLAALHVLYTPNDLSADKLLKFYLTALCVLGLAAYIYRTLLPNVFIRRYPYIIQSVEPKGGGVMRMNLVPEKRPMSFKAGQFIFISFHQEGLPREWHPFTVSSGPSSGGFSLTVKALGSYTKVLTTLAPAMTMQHVLIEGAYGRFSYRNFDNHKQVWVAGGIGVTPFLSMADALGPGPYNIDLYYSVKNESELIDIAMLQGLQSLETDRIFRVIPFIGDKQGFLSAKYMQQITGPLAERDILLCGPPPMMQSLKGQLKALGVKKSRIHSEEFSMS